MKTPILIVMASLLVVSACNNKEDFYNKEASEAFVGASVMPPDPSDLISGNSCSDITNVMTCKSSSGCEPVFESENGVITEEQEESKFSLCISAPDKPKNESTVFVDMPGENKPVEDKPAEDKPVADKPTEDKPVADKPAEDKPVADKPAEDKPVADKPTEDKPVADKPTEDKPVADKPTEDKPVADKPTEDKPVADKPTEDKPVADKPTENPTPTKDPKPSVAGNCDHVDIEHLVFKNGTKKVILCHNANAKKITIIVSCSAYPAHATHHGDSDGPCKIED